MAFTACCKPSPLLALRASSRGSPVRAQALLRTPSTSAFHGLKAPPSAAPARGGLHWHRLQRVCLQVSKGSVPPSFILKDQNGKPVSLSKFKGKPVVVYFYPVDETPGCTKQACAFLPPLTHLVVIKYRTSFDNAY